MTTHTTHATHYPDRSHGGPTRHRAECGCGWHSSSYSTDEAERTARRHAAAFGGCWLGRRVHSVRGTSASPLDRVQQAAMDRHIALSPTGETWVIREQGEWCDALVSDTAAEALAVAADYTSSPVHACPVADELIYIAVTARSTVTVDPDDGSASMTVHHEETCPACGEHIALDTKLTAERADS